MRMAIRAAVTPNATGTAGRRRPPRRFNLGCLVGVGGGDSASHGSVMRQNELQSSLRSGAGQPMLGCRRGNLSSEPENPLIPTDPRSEEHTSELQSPMYLV